jgi:signal transduction histidine kinase
MLGVPLIVGGEVIGVLHVGVMSKRLFAADDVELLELVASRVALAIERARLHEELRMLEQLKANFVAIASHELRTPAASVYGVLTTLAHHDKDLSPDVREELLRTGVQQGERLRRLLEDLLDLSRLDSGVIRVNAKPLVVRTAIEAIARDALPAGTPVRLEISPDLAAVVDRLVLERVLSNLLTNAARHGDPPLLVGAEQRDQHLRIAVSDEGRGVPEEMQARLFERFARGDNAAGSGLGLAIARSYARAHGGDIVYAPQVRGARFELVLPQA